MFLKLSENSAATRVARRKLIRVQGNMSLPFSGLNCKQTKISRACFMLVSLFPYTLALKIELTCSFQAPDDNEMTTWRYVLKIEYS